MFVVSTIFPQNKPTALKFDEFTDSVENQFYSDDNKLTFSQRIERFSKQLEKERAGKAYIIYYQARITYKNFGWNFGNRVDRINNQIKYNDRIKVEDVVTVNGGYRENNTVEFWIVPKNAEPPAPTPTLDKSETFVCPNIFISNDTPFNQTETLVFSIPSFYLREMENYSLTWKVSAGEIVEGQGLDFIKVKLNGSVPKRVTAFLEVGGLPFPCRKVFSAEAEIGGKLFLIDSFVDLTNGDIKARLDAFMTSLQKNSTAKGYITIYGNRTEGNREVARKVVFYKNYLLFRNFDASRIAIINGGFREETSAELWLSFDDNEKPIPTPTVDKKFVEVPVQTRKPRRNK